MKKLIITLVSTVLAGGILLSAAPVQAEQPPLWQLMGVGCLSADNSEPENRAALGEICMFFADDLGIAYDNFVLTRCASDESEDSNRPTPYSPNAFCTAQCADDQIEYNCAAFVRPGD